jgi:hypothetical protein
MKPFWKLAAIVITGVVLAFAATQWRDWAFRYEEAKEKRELRQRWGGGTFVPITKQTLARIATAAQDAARSANTNGWCEAAAELKLGAMVSLLLDTYSSGDWASFEELCFPVPPESCGGLETDRMRIIRAAWAREQPLSNLPPLEGLSDQTVFVQWGRYLVLANAGRYGHGH